MVTRPLLYLVDAAGGRISEQIKIFPGRFHAGRIFYKSRERPDEPFSPRRIQSW